MFIGLLFCCDFEFWIIWNILCVFVLEDLIFGLKYEVGVFIDFSVFICLIGCGGVFVIVMDVDDIVIVCGIGIGVLGFIV